MCCESTGHHKGMHRGHHRGHQGDTCGCGHDSFGPAFWTKEEKIARLEECLASMQERVKAVKERIVALKEE
ncbi:MAG: hypothetical protein GY832_18075 [Chloroflexi bacterium]|nr:hypothetical protein [Chloroflexota bacterium]